LKGELIGKEVVVVDSKNKSNIGIEGKIVNETKNTIWVSDKESNLKKLIKKNIVLLFKNEKIKVDGKILVGRPEDRLKK